MVPQPSADSAAAIATRIGEKRAHVVLDNLEQLLPDATRPLAELLAAAPALRIVATSRESLRIAGESEFDLPPMDEGDAVTLFIERAQAVRADIGDSPAVHELIRRLDGLPLAIELAAARVKLLGPEQLLERIAQRLDLLKGGRDAEERHATLRATIGWSYDLLDDDEQQLFARLAVFRGGCTLDAAEAVCDADLDTLASLLDKSLLRRRTDANGDERFWMLETIREFAWERLEASGEEDALRRLQTDWLLELADRAGTRATVGVAGKWNVDLVAPEVDNVRAVLDWAAEHDPERGLVLAASLEGFWLVREPSRAPHASNHCSHEPRTPSRSFAPTRCGHSAVRSSSPANPNVPRPATSTASSSSSRAETRSRRRTSATASLQTWWITAIRPPPGRCSRNHSVHSGSSACLAVRPRYSDTSRTRPTKTAIWRSRSSFRSRAPPSPMIWAGHGGRQASSVVQPGSSASAAASMPRRIMPSGRSSSLSASAGGALVFAATELAILAAERGDAERAGRLWGAVESEVSFGPRRPVGGPPRGARKPRPARKRPCVQPRAGGGQPDVDRRGCRLVPAG